MRICLLDHPRLISEADFEDIINAPLSSSLFTGYAASVLSKHGFQVEVIDAHLSGWIAAETIQTLAGERFDLLGVNLIYSWDETASSLSMLSQLKAQHPQTHLTLFGYYPTFAYQDLLKTYPFIDSIIIGEVEGTILELSSKLKEGKGKRGKGFLPAIKGLAYRPGDRIIRTSPRPLRPDLDSLPFPARSDLSKLKGIHPFILGSRGCWNNCSFCHLNRFYRRCWRGRSPLNIVTEIEEVLNQMGGDYIYFADANFFGPGKAGTERARDIAELIKDRLPGIHFGLETRSPDIKDPTVIEKLVEAGLSHIFLGVESGSDRVLKEIRKGTSLEENRRAVDILNQFTGLKIYLGFIMFTPDSTLQDVKANLQFLKETGLMNSPSATAHLLYHPLRLLKGSQAYHDYLAEGRADLSSFGGYEAKYTYLHPEIAALAEFAGQNSKALLAQLRKQRALPPEDRRRQEVLWRSSAREDCLRKPDQFSDRLNSLLIKSFEEAMARIALNA
ncbi:MAG: radical SAM protein [bacterium]